MDFYQIFQQELNKFTPEIKRIVAELVNKEFWFEIGKALNSFPIGEEVNKFKLKRQLESYMLSKNLSDLDLDNELKELDEKGYVYARTKSMPNYFCTLEFAQAVKIVDIIEKGFISPLVKELERRKEFKQYKHEDLKRSLELQFSLLLQ